MYKEFYGLREYPFNMTPEPAFLFLSRHHRVALDVLLYGIRERKGFIAITGEVGAGKTTLCRALLNSLDSKTKTALILNPSLSDSQVLRAITDEFRLQPAKTTKKDLYDSINGFLIRELAANNNVALIVDEAQNLKPSVLEQIRLLSNLETEKEKLLQIVLVGQPELAQILDQPSLRQLKQRISLRYHVASLAPEEVGEYIEHRLHVAGGDGRIQWAPETLTFIYSYSRGIPRLINVLCDKALLAGYIAETFVITARNIKRAIEDTECKLPASAIEQRRGANRMSLVHEALQKAEREKQRKLGTTPSAPVSHAGPQTVVHTPVVTAPVAHAAPATVPHKPAATVEEPTETNDFLLPGLIGCVAIVAIIAIVFIVSNATSVLRQPKESSPVAVTAATPAAAAQTAPAVVPQPTPAQTPAESAALVNVPPPVAPVTDESKYKISGIMKDPDGKPVAVLNGRVAYEGYFIDGATVKKIETDRVTLDIKGRELVLRLY